MRIEKIDFGGLPALGLEAGGYEAIIVPSIGSNIVRLFHQPTGANILRTPQADEFETFKARPQVFGVPLLFPPNRIEDGTYTYEGQKYQYPITIPAENNYHHGIIKSKPFVVTKTSTGADFVEIETSFFSNCFQDEIYVNFPHSFECRMTFNLSAGGLKQTITFVNLSDRKMPVGMGLHTVMNVPFIEGSNRDNYRIKLSAGKRWELNSRTLPTEKLLDLTDDEALLRTEGIAPCGKEIISVMTNEPITADGKPYSGAILTDEANGVSVYYETDSQFKHWTLWNNGGEALFICPEPQSWTINAPNLRLPTELTGFKAIDPGASWDAVTHFYVK